MAIALPNGPAMLEVAFACWALGATPAPVSHRLPPLELQAILALLDPKVIVGGAAARAAGAAVVDEQALYDPLLSAAPLPERISKHVKAIASGGSTGRPKSSSIMQWRYSIRIRRRWACVPATPS